jgi:hypothetical protein
MIDFLFELELDSFTFGKSSRLGLIIYFCKKNKKNLNYEDYEYSYLFQWSLTKSRRC